MVGNLPIMALKFMDYSLGGSLAKILPLAV